MIDPAPIPLHQNRMTAGHDQRKQAAHPTRAALVMLVFLIATGILAVMFAVEGQQIADTSVNRLFEQNPDNNPLLGGLPQSTPPPTSTPISVGDLETYDIPDYSVLYSFSFPDAGVEFGEQAILYAPGGTGLDIFYENEDGDLIEVVLSPSPYNLLVAWASEARNYGSLTIDIDRARKVPLATAILSNGFNFKTFILDGIFVSISGANTLEVQEFTEVFIGIMQPEPPPEPTAASTQEDPSVTVSIPEPVDIPGFEGQGVERAIDPLVGTDVLEGLARSYISIDGDEALVVIYTQSPYANFSEWLQTQRQSPQIETINGITVALSNVERDESVAAFQWNGVFVSITLTADRVRLDDIRDVATLYLEQLAGDEEVAAPVTDVQIEIEDYEVFGTPKDNPAALFGASDRNKYMPGSSGYVYFYENPQDGQDRWLVTLSIPPYESIEEWIPVIESVDNLFPFTTRTVTISGVEVVIADDEVQTVYGMLMKNTLVIIMTVETQPEPHEFVEAYIDAFLSR